MAGCSCRGQPVEGTNQSWLSKRAPAGSEGVRYSLPSHPPGEACHPRVSASCDKPFPPSLRATFSWQESAGVQICCQEHSRFNRVTLETRLEPACFNSAVVFISTSTSCVIIHGSQTKMSLIIHVSHILSKASYREAPFSLSGCLVYAAPCLFPFMCGRTRLR